MSKYKKCSCGKEIINPIENNDDLELMEEFFETKNYCVECCYQNLDKMRDFALRMAEKSGAWLDDDLTDLGECGELII